MLIVKVQDAITSKLHLLYKQHEAQKKNYINTDTTNTNTTPLFQSNLADTGLTFTASGKQNCSQRTHQTVQLARCSAPVIFCMLVLGHPGISNILSSRPHVLVLMLQTLIFLFPCGTDQWQKKFCTLAQTRHPTTQSWHTQLPSWTCLHQQHLACYNNWTHTATQWHCTAHWATAPLNLWRLNFTWHNYMYKKIQFIPCSKHSGF